MEWSLKSINSGEGLGCMNFLVGIHTKDYNGTPNKKGEIDFVMTGIKVLKLPEMEFYDIMFKDYTDYSNDELYSLLDSINGWKYSRNVYREKDILYVSCEHCNLVNLGGVSLYQCADFVPLFCNNKLVNSTADKLKIIQFSNVSLLNITILVNLASYEVGIIADGHYIFGDLKFKGLHYDYDGFYKVKDEYTKSFLVIYSVNDPYFINDIVPIDYENNGLLVIGDRCVLSIEIIHNDKNIILPNGVKELVLSGVTVANSKDNKVTLVIPPSIDRLFIDSDGILNYSGVNIKLVFARQSDISGILYYLYRCTYSIPKDFRDILGSKASSEDELSYRDRVLNYIENNKDEMVSLLVKSGLSIDFYG